MQILRLLSLVTTATTVALLGCGDASSDLPLEERLAELDQPNIVLVLVDTLRSDWLDPYGYERTVSPEIADWASRGVLFERVLAQSSWTKTSMASLLTSLWPRTHGVEGPTDGLGEDAEMLAEVLQQAGYATAAVQTNAWLEQSFGFQQGFDHYAFPRAATAVRHGFSSVWGHRDRVLEETQRLLENRDEEKPLFLYVHFMDVHEYGSPPEYREFGNDEKGFYLAAIRWVDEGVQHIREMLESNGMLDDTILVFASDHGEAFGENQVHGHANNVLSPVLRVPLIIRLPFDVPERRVRTQVRNIDIAPTLLDFAGVPIPHGFEGESLLPLMSGPEPEEDRPSYASLGAHIIMPSELQIAVNDGNWTLVRSLERDRDEKLFDLALDPQEDANLIDLEPEQAAKMRRVLDAHQSVGARPGVNREEVRINPGIAERLRAVGYLQ